MKNLIFILLAVFLLVNTALHAQSPWPRGKASLYAQLAYNFIPKYGSLLGPHWSETKLNSKVFESTMQMYAEYGLSSRTTIVGSFPLHIQRASAPSSRITTLSVGNISLAARQAILTGKVRLTGTLQVDFPVPNFDATFRNGFNAYTFLPMLSTGMSLGDIYWFAFGGVGLRTHPYSNFGNAGAECGVKLNKVWVIGYTEWKGPIKAGSNTLSPDLYDSGLFLDKQGWLSFGGKIIYRLNRFCGLTASVAGAAWGQYVPRSPGLGIGGYFNWE